MCFKLIRDVGHTKCITFIKTDLIFYMLFTGMALKMRLFICVVSDSNLGERALCDSLGFMEMLLDVPVARVAMTKFYTEKAGQFLH